MDGQAKVIYEIFQSIPDNPVDRNIILVASGHFIGEGFYEPRLDTLFLAMPISWKGTLQQYAGRLHRLYEATLDLLTNCGASVVFKSNIHQKFAVMDQKIVWYGQYQLVELWKCSGKHHANRKFQYCERIDEAHRKGVI